MSKVASCHPDKGGDAETFLSLQQVYESYVQGESKTSAGVNRDSSKPRFGAELFAMSEAEYTEWHIQMAVQCLSLGMAALQSGLCLFLTS